MNEEIEALEYERAVASSRCTKEAVLGLVLAIAGGSLLYFIDGDPRVQYARQMAEAALVVGPLMMAWAGWRWVRLRRGDAPVGEIMAPVLTGAEQRKAFALTSGGDPVVSVVFRRNNLRGVLEGVRVRWRGQEVGSIEILETSHPLLLSDGSVLTLRLVKDFVQHRRLVVEHDDMPLEELTSSQ